METVLKTKKHSIREALADISTDISWAKISRKYFDKSSSWIYHKIDGIGNNGVPSGFTPEELEQFKGALVDLSDRIRKAADKIDSH